MPRRIVPNSDCLALGARVRELRQEQGLSQGKLSKVGALSKGHLSNIERGFVNTTVGTVFDIAKTLQVLPMHVMCFGDSELEKFAEEFRTMPDEEQSKVLAELSRTLPGGVKVRGPGGTPPVMEPRKSAAADPAGDDADASSRSAVGVRGA
jgi:transcriptional regulator with XRE-family HTH domain